MTTRDAAPASKRWALFWTLVLPGLGHYYSGASFAASLSVFALSQMMSAVILWGVPAVLPWRPALAACAFLILAYVGALMLSALHRLRTAGASRPPLSIRHYARFVLAVIAFGGCFEVTVNPGERRGLKSFKVTSASMEPNIKSGDRVMARISDFAEGKGLRRGDLIVFRYPRDPRITYVKRLVGLPGDRVRLDNGSLVINGERQRLVESLDRAALADVSTEPSTEPSAEPVTEPSAEPGTEPSAEPGTVHLFTESLDGKPYLIRKKSAFGPDAAGNSWPRDGSTYEVEGGKLFVLGDNRDEAVDSRIFGLVPIYQLIGRVEGVLYSISPTKGLRSERVLLPLR